MKTVVIGLDGSADSARALPLAVELVDDDGRLVAVHVRELMMGRGGSQTVAPNEDEIEAGVRHTVDELNSKGVTTELKVISAVSGGPAHVLADVARAEHADVIVVGTRGHRQIASLVIGSVTHRLLHIAHCAVLAVPPTVPAEATHNSRPAAAAHAG
jgi:nucleotide-binding universal stress UspA family protein